MSIWAYLVELFPAEDTSPLGRKKGHFWFYRQKQTYARLTSGHRLQCFLLAVSTFRGELEVELVEEEEREVSKK